MAKKLTKDVDGSSEPSTNAPETITVSSSESVVIVSPERPLITAEKVKAAFVEDCIARKLRDEEKELVLSSVDSALARIDW